jgi:hypothetical protein
VIITGWLRINLNWEHDSKPDGFGIKDTFRESKGACTLDTCREIAGRDMARIINFKTNFYEQFSKTQQG